MDDSMYVWPCGSYCTREYLEYYLTFMSDDYETLTEDEFYEKFPEEME